MTKIADYLTVIFNTTLVILFFVWIVLDSDKPYASSEIVKMLNPECTSVEKAAEMAKATIEKLADLKTAGKISSAEYNRRIKLIGFGLEVWSSRDDISGYCTSVLEANRM
jgi:hypothetical protein